MADYHLTHNAADIDPALTAAENSAQVTGILKGAGDGTYTNQPVDGTPVNASTNLITSGAVYTALAGKQDTLTIDAVPTDGSSNPVQSNGVYDALVTKQNVVTYTDTGDGNIVIS